MIGRLIGLAVFGSGFVAAATIAASQLAAADLLVVLASMLIAECLASIIAAPRAVTSQSDCDAERALAQTLILWLMMAAASAAAMHLGVLPLFDGQPVAVAGLLGLSLLLAMLRLASSHLMAKRVGLRLLTSSRWWLSCGAWVLIGNFATSDPGIMVLSAILTGLLLLLCASLGMRGAVAPAHSAEVPANTGWWWYGDLLLLPFFLSGGEALTYLLARTIAQPIIHGVCLLEQQALPLLQQARRARAAGEFVASAARLNLGILLVGGGLALAILSLGRVLPQELPVNAGYLREVITWVVLGAAAPALFGASDAIFRGFGQADILLLLRSLALLLFAAAMFLSPTQTALVTAQKFAGMQLAVAGVSAIILAKKVGIWPGITAVLLRQIRAF